MSKFCTKCGTSLPDESKFCPACGASQEIQTTAAPVTPPPATPVVPTAGTYSNAGSGSYSNPNPGAGYTAGAQANPDLVTPDKLKVQPGVAALLSVLVVGLGQMINGQLAKGLVLIGGAMVLGVITCGIAAIPCWVISGIDAYKCAQALAEGRTIGKWSFWGKS